MAIHQNMTIIEKAGKFDCDIFMESIKYTQLTNYLYIIIIISQMTNRFNGFYFHPLLCLYRVLIGWCVFTFGFQHYVSDHCTPARCGSWVYLDLRRFVVKNQNSEDSTTLSFVVNSKWWSLFAFHNFTVGTRSYVFCCISIQCWYTLMLVTFRFYISAQTTRYMNTLITCQVILQTSPHRLKSIFALPTESRIAYRVSHLEFVSTYITLKNRY